MDSLASGRHKTPPLQLNTNGIARRLEESVMLLRPGRQAGPWSVVEVEKGLADDYRLADGDVVEGELDSAGRITQIHRINGLDLTEANARPLPRPHRNAL